MNSRRLLPAMLLLFVGSGCAALIYEVVWFQLLELVIGSSAVSLAVLLGTVLLEPLAPLPRAAATRSLAPVGEALRAFVMMWRLFARLP